MCLDFRPGSQLLIYISKVDAYSGASYAFLLYLEYITESVETLTLIYYVTDDK